MDLKDVVLKIARTASDLLVRDGMVHPVAFLLDPDGKTNGCIALDFSSPEAKELSIDLARTAARKGGMVLAYVTEAWMSRDPRPGVAPSKAPDREEVLVIAAFSPHSVAGALVRFSRDPDGNPVPSQPELIEHRLESRMDPWPDRQPAH
jgi:hypothetical protein